MQINSQDDYPQVGVLDLDASAQEIELLSDDYLLKSREKLDAISALINQGETVDPDSHAWMLSQVDFIIDSIGNETLELGTDMRSDLLQLLLAIANLNEQIRHQAASEL
jgi:hypothetical protein